MTSWNLKDMVFLLEEPPLQLVQPNKHKACRIPHRSVTILPISNKCIWIQENPPRIWYHPWISIHQYNPYFNLSWTNFRVYRKYILPSLYVSTYLYGGKPMPMTAAMSRSAALTAMPSVRTRQASFTTGKNIISTMSFSDNFDSCIQVQYHQMREWVSERSYRLSIWCFVNNFNVVLFTVSVLDIISNPG